MLEQVAMLSASRLNQVTIFGLGIMPYISASIIFQLLASVYPPLEQLQKEGEAGRKKINEYTALRRHSVSAYSKAGLHKILRRRAGIIDPAFDVWYWKLTTVLTMTAGTHVSHVARRADR